MPAALCHTGLNPRSVTRRIGRTVGPAGVARAVTSQARRDDVQPISAPVLAGGQMLRRGLEPAGLGPREVMPHGEAIRICEPHRLVAVVAATVLAAESRVASGGITGHGLTSQSGRKDPFASIEVRQGTCTLWRYRHNTVALANWHAR